MSDHSLYAKALAESDAATQAEFFNQFSHFLRLCCKGQWETQCHYMADHLDTNGAALCDVLHHSAIVAAESRAKAQTEISLLWDQRRNLEKEIEELTKIKELKNE